MSGSESRSGLEVAIVGMAGRFPGAADVEQLWRNLREGVESVRFFSDEELAAAGIPAELRRDPRYVPAKGWVAGADELDAAFFGLSPREAELMDPQQRLFLECAWQAIESAGYDVRRYPGWIGVYGGTATSTYFLRNLAARPDLLAEVGSFQVSLLNDKDYLATRVSYKLDLEGPSLTVQTGCSTSLTAVHLACQALLRGECDMALAGGVSIGVPLVSGYLYQEGGILSPDGHTRSFDARARGCVGGNGVAMVLLKRLEDALADRDPVRAVIRGSALNNDGAQKIGFTAPRSEGQAKVIRAAHHAAGVSPEDITCIEAHGTATELGDPVEVAALHQVFAAATDRKGFCALGSIKSNVGHLDAAAGAAGLIKMALALENREIPPSLHFERPNPQIDFAAGPFFVNSALRPWEVEGGGVRRAGVSSFGIGGTNAHVVLEEAPEPAASLASRPWQLLLLSARSAPALEQAGRNLTRHLAQSPPGSLADVAYTLQVGRAAFGHRRIAVCRDAAEAAAALAGGAPEDGGWRDPEQPAPAVAFLFPGQGAQHPGMAAGLYGQEPTFRHWVDTCCERLAPRLGVDLRQLLLSSGGEEDREALRQTRLAQPALFVMEHALARLWMEWGIRPRALLGHSLGEYVAACLAGVFRLEDALELVVLRGELMQGLPPGAMLTVPLPEGEVLRRLTGGLSLASVNGPGLCGVAGPAAEVEALRARLEAEGVEARLLETSHAFHSALVDPVRERFVAAVAKLPRETPQIPFLSNVTGTWIEPDQATDPAYWGEHLRRTVRFGAGLEELLEAGLILLEVGPGASLTAMARRHPGRDAGTLALSSCPAPRDPAPGGAHLLETLGRLWLAGVEPSWTGFYRHEERRRLTLPTYPFERQRYWVEPLPGGQAALSLEAVHAGARRDPADRFYAPVWKQVPLPRELGGEPGSAAGRWLLFLDGCGIGARLAGRLAGLGAQVATVEPGERFERIAPEAYRIDPGSQDQHRELLRAWGTEPGEAARIVHLWSLTPGPAASASAIPELARALGLFSLAGLAQGIGERKLAGGLGPVAVTVVSNHLHAVTGEEDLCPEKATLLGAVLAMPQEYPGLSCRSLDLALPANGENVAVTAGTEHLVDLLLEDLLAGPPGAVAALRAGRRWVRAFEPVHLGEPAAGSRLRQGGVYLITGGLGGIGLEIAGHLAREARAKLVLVGRSPVPPRSEWPRRAAGEDPLAGPLRRLLEMEAEGAEVLALSADVCDPARMREAVAEASRAFGAVHGVVHAAGVAGGRLLQLQSPAEAAAVLAPKVEGTRALAAALAGTPLDFFVLCSSQRAILGGAGQADYCAANAFLDAFAQERRRAGEPVLAIDWDGWSEVGMGRAAALRAGGGKDGEEELAAGLGNEEGVDAFRRALATGFAQLVVSTDDFPGRVERFARSRAAAVLDAAGPGAGQSQRYPRPDLATPYAEPRDAAERTLAEIWERLLGVQPVGIHDNFFELGGDSVLSLQIVAQANQAGLRLTPRQVFEHETIAALAAVATAAGVEDAARAEQGPVAGPVPLTPIQRWLLERRPADLHHYNQTLLVECAAPLDPSLVAAAFGRLLEHHDALRSRFVEGEDGWEQSCALPGGPVPFTRIDLSIPARLAPGRLSTAVAEAAAGLQAGFDLARGPVARCVLFDPGAGAPQRLFLSAHHLVVDVVSWRVLLEDLATAYGQLAAGRAVELPPKTTSFRQWAQRLQAHAAAPGLEAELAYWLARPWEQVRPLPRDLPSGANTVASARTLDASLDEETTQALLQEVPRVSRVQPQELLLAALAWAGQRWTGHPLLAVDVEGHGREPLFDDVDLSRTVGWFTTLFPVLLDGGGFDRQPGPALQRVKEDFRAVPGRGAGFGVLRHLTGGEPAARLAALPQPELLFLYTGAAAQEPAGPGLPYRPSAEPPGPQQSPGSLRSHLLEVTAGVADGRLQVRWTYSASLHPESAVAGLADGFLAAVRELVRHARTPESAASYTPSDFPLAGLDQDDLLDLVAEFGGLDEVKAG